MITEVQKFICSTFARMDFDLAPTFENLSDEDKLSWQSACETNNQDAARAMVSKEISNQMARLYLMAGTDHK